MEVSDDELVDKVHRLKLLLTGRAVGGKEEADDDEYQRLRSDLVKSPVGPQLPSVARRHRTLVEFWSFIRPKFQSYAERRSYIQDEFEPLLNELEGLVPKESAEVAPKSNQPHQEAIVATESADKNRMVFVVYGRNSAAQDELFAFLRALHLKPLEWGHVRKLTGKPNPYVGEILAAGFKAAQAAVVLFTPDDEARLRVPYQTVNDGADETELTGQPRQNVLFEAGMAMGFYEDRTLLVEMGNLRQMSDIKGRHVIRLNDSAETRNEFVERLREVGCSPDTVGSHWLKVGKFNQVLRDIRELPSGQVQPAAQTPVAPDELDELSKEERDYLMDLSRPRNIEGLSLSVVDEMSGHEIKYVEMIDHFVELKILRERSEVYSLTTKGRAIADRIWEHRILSVLNTEPLRSHDIGVESLSTATNLDDGKPELDELSRHLQSLHSKKFVDGGTSGTIRISTAGVEFLRQSPSDNEDQ